MLRFPPDIRQLCVTPGSCEKINSPEVEASSSDSSLSHHDRENHEPPLPATWGMFGLQISPPSFASVPFYMRPSVEQGVPRGGRGGQLYTLRQEKGQAA